MKQTLGCPTRMRGIVFEDNRPRWDMLIRPDGRMAGLIQGKRVTGWYKDHDRLIARMRALRQPAA